MNKSSKDNKNQVVSLLDEAYTSRVNNLQRSIELGKKALLISRELNDKALIGRSLSQLSLFYMISGNYKPSMNMAKEAIEYFQELKDEKSVANAKYNIAGIYYKTDNYHLGLVNFIECLSIYRKYNDYQNQARVLKSLGTIYEFFGDQKNAVKEYKNAIKAAKKAKDLNTESNVYNPLSGIYLNQNKIDKALELIERSIAMKQQTGDIRGLAFALYGRGKIYTHTKQFTEAERDFKESMRIHIEMGEMLGLGMTYYKMGALYVEMKAFDKAKDILQKGLDYSNKYNVSIIKYKCNYLFYQIYKQENNLVKSVEYLEQYLKQKEGVINTQTLKVIENYELITKMESIEKEAQLQSEKAEIIEKKNRAENAAKVKQEFLSTMSHEIRTPLNAVITISSLLREKSDKEDKQLLDSLKFSSNNLLLIINDILDFTKLESGKVHIDNRPIDFIGLVENLKNTYESLSKEKGLKLYLQYDSEVSNFYELDETKISQILGNLITNAIKFTDNGQVDIIIDKIAGDNIHDLIRFKISDTGVGVEENFINEIFESFTQPKSITTKKHGGTGLGLAIVKKLVELHGSTILISSEVGKGSTFYFDLKLKKSNSPNITPRKDTSELKNKIILLAEDNMINAMVAIKLISKWGITTEHVKNGVEAVEKTKQKKYDYILMDIHMPEMDGFEATELIKNTINPNHNTPIFALTADITAEQQETYMSFFNGFLLKPIEIDKLYEALTTP